MRYCLLLIVVLICTSCSLPMTKNTELTDLESSYMSKVFNIQFSRWSESTFSGLLAVKREGDTLRYVLLDGSGITLAQARVHGDGNFSELKAVAKMKESGLPAFLASVLQRIYLVKPANTPCSQTFFFKLCEEKGTTINRKFMRIGPFTVYDIQYEKENESRNLMTLIYSQPWLGIQITLRPLSSKK